MKGNITAEDRNGSSFRTATYTGARLTTDSVSGFSSRYLYDAYGNVDCVVAASWAAPSCPTAATGQTVASELLSDNVYDYRDRLLAVRNYAGGVLGDRSEYRYDPLARPTKKISTVDGTTTTTDMLYLGLDDQVIRETETGTTTKTRAYAFDALGQRATLSENGSRYSYVVDHRDSVEALLDQTNGIKAAYGYRAYGEANPSLTKTAGGFDASTNLYRYTGKRFDPAAKAYDMGARHYFPVQARWFQQDLYPDALANLGLSTDPLNANRYVFTGANPINYIEVDGHVADPAAGGRRNWRKGNAFDRKVGRELGLTEDKNVRPDAKTGRRFAYDGRSGSARFEIKNTNRVSMSTQLRAQLRNLPKGHSLNLVVAERTKVSKKVQREIARTGGQVIRRTRPGVYKTIGPTPVIVSFNAGQWSNQPVKPAQPPKPPSGGSGNFGSPAGSGGGGGGGGGSSGGGRRMTM